MKTLSLILAIAAFIISVIALIFSSQYCICFDINSVSLSIITICTTLIVGFAVVDTLRVYQVEQKVKSIEHNAAHLENANKEVTIAVYIAYGLAVLNWLPYTAFIYFRKGLRQALITKDANWIGQCLKCMRNVPKVINRMKGKGDAVKDAAKDRLTPEVPDDIQELDLYRSFKDEIDKIHEDINKLK